MIAGMWAHSIAQAKQLSSGPCKNLGMSTCSRESFSYEAPSTPQSLDHNRAVQLTLLYCTMANLHEHILVEHEENEECIAFVTLTELRRTANRLGMTIQQFLLLMSMVYQMPAMRAESILSVYSIVTQPRGKLGVSFIHHLASMAPSVDDAAAIREIWWERVIARGGPVEIAMNSNFSRVDYPRTAKEMAPILTGLRQESVDEM